MNAAKMAIFKNTMSDWQSDGLSEGSLKRVVRMPRRKYKISESRILQICNDIAEDMGRYSKADLVEVVKYQCDVVSDECQKRSALRSAVVLRTLEHTNGMLEMLRHPNDGTQRRGHAADEQRKTPTT